MLTLRIVDKQSRYEQDDITQSRISDSGTSKDKKACGDAEAAVREGGNEAAGD